MTNALFRGTLLLSALALTACKGPAQQCLTGDEDVCDAGSVPDDLCNSREEALSDSRCILTLGTAVTDRYISTLADGGPDRDWYSVQLGPLTERSLLHVNAGYSVPQTAVNFSVNVLKEDGTTSVAAGLDHHGAAGPKPVDLVLPYSGSNEKLLVLLADEGGAAQVRVDNRNPYHVLVEVLDNPDTNEPNDTTPTRIQLSSAGGMQSGMSSGYLATNDDVDRYVFNVTGSRQIIYLHLTAPMLLNPQPKYRVSYVLYDPAMQPISEGVMANEFLKLDLATARLAAQTGDYTLVVQGYHSPNTPNEVVPGDIRPDARYDVLVEVMPDQDPSEPNDTMATAHAVALSVGGSSTLQGRIAYIPDDEWFALDLAPSAQTTVLRYKVAMGSGGGRFPPTAALPTRQLRLTTEVTQGATSEDRQVACKTDRTVCPRGDTIDPQLGRLVSVADAMCAVSDPPQCLWAEHNEDPKLPNLRNFDGAIPVPPHGATQRVYLVLRDVGRGQDKYADDKDYSLSVSYETDFADGPATSALGGSTTVTTGQVNYGFGRYTNPPFDINNGAGVRGPADYQAVPTDLDTFEYTLPSGSDLAWQLSWDTSGPDGGSPPQGELTVELAFCQAAGPLPCSSNPETLAYTGDNLTPWYLPRSLGNAQVLFSRSSSGNTATVTLLPVGCWCVPAATAGAGHFFLTVGGYNQGGAGPIVYHLRQSVLAYPQSYPSADGGTASCPVSDGGCRFGL